MPNTGYRSITIREETVVRMGLSSEKVMTELEKRLDEQTNLQKLASKITKAPEIVLVYSPFSVKKERGEREKP